MERRTVPLYFLDYSFHLDSDNNLQFDKDLSPHQLYVKEGDEFIVEVRDGMVTFVKQCQKS